MTFQPLIDWATKWQIPVAALHDLPRHFHTGITTNDNTSEAGVQSALRVTAPKLTHSLWRNNKGATQDVTGRLIRYGLGHDSKRLDEVWKSSDLIGITRVLITDDYVGRILGVFTGVEVKEPGWKGPRTKEENAQASFLATVNAMGGIGMFATSTEEYITRVPQWER